MDYYWFETEDAGPESFNRVWFFEDQQVNIAPDSTMTTTGPKHFLGDDDIPGGGGDGVSGQEFARLWFGSEETSYTKVAIASMTYSETNDTVSFVGYPGSSSTSPTPANPDSSTRPRISERANTSATSEFPTSLGRLSRWLIKL